jgi:hypothetical protein
VLDVVTKSSYQVIGRCGNVGRAVDYGNRAGLGGPVTVDLAQDADQLLISLVHLVGEEPFDVAQPQPQPQSWASVCSVPAWPPPAAGRADYIGMCVSGNKGP